MDTANSVAGEIRYRTIDSCLGPGMQRFFGEGYKRSLHRVGPVSVVAHGEGTGSVHGTASVEYPVDWSRKRDSDQRPHLSTIDVYLLSAQLCELYLAVAYGATEEDRAAAWLRKVRIRAGSKPVEDDLGGFDIGARLVTYGQAPGSPDRSVAVFDAKIGALSVRVEIECPTSQPTEFQGTFTSLDEGLGPSDRRVMASAHKSTRHNITNVLVEKASPSTASGTVRLESSVDTSLDLGLEADSHPSVSMVDTFVVGLQLGQVLLYELDGVSRADSNTLWMRQTTLETTTPVRPVPNQIDTDFALDNVALLTAGDGAVWRRADIVGELAGVVLRCSVAHRLPDGVSGAAAEGRS